MENFKCIILGDFSVITNEDNSECKKNMENIFILIKKLLMSEFMSVIIGELLFELIKLLMIINININV